jgi:hypothetical protein
MTKTFTKNDLILFIYNELSPDLKNEMRVAIACDEEMASDFYALKNAKFSLPKVTFKPSEKSISKIRAYMSSLI